MQSSFLSINKSISNTEVKIDALEREGSCIGELVALLFQALESVLEGEKRSGVKANRTSGMHNQQDNGSKS